MGQPNNKKKTARYVAAESLNRLFKQQLPAKQVLDRLCTEAKLSEIDRNLAMNLVFGVLRKRDTLNFLIEQLSTTKLKKLPPFVHQALAVGLYQIFFLDSIPSSAAVNEAVKSCGQANIPQRLHGFVNGVLRNSIREKEKLSTQLDKNRAKLTNHPSWLTKRWRQQYSEETVQKICDINGQEPSLSIRVNSCRITVDDYFQKLQEAEIAAKRGLSPAAILLPEFSGKINKLPGYKEGWFQVQDEAAQLATLLFQPIEENGSYLDCCAGLGGKTAHIMQIGHQHKTKVTAIEPEKGRQDKFSENMQRLFPDQEYELHTSTVQEFAATSTEQFSGILVDAPCSGTGVIRRQPDIKWNRRESDFAKNQKLQLEILTAAATLLKPGGILIYATCSLEQEENDQVISKFLDKQSEFKLSYCSDFLPEAARKYTRTSVVAPDAEGDFFAPLPDNYIDGFFAARLVKMT